MKLNWKIQIVFTVLTIVFLYIFLFSPPARFPSGKIVTIYDGMSLRQISKTLKEEKIIRSRFIFEIIVVTLGNEKGVLASNYLFEKPIGVVKTAWRLVRWQHNLAPAKITFPEGMAALSMAALLEKELTIFDKEKFLEMALPKEGRLFPDTYFLFLDAKPEVIIGQMLGNFEKKIRPLEERIAESGRTLDEIITMASILEKEANIGEERQVVSGILWKRLSIGMPLQVDATFLYINGKGTYDLTKDDLAIDSPYNTYKYKGLPPGPIGNPGFDAIMAALTPKESPYLFYLHDRKGKIYYAKTFEEHVKNKRKYL
jgi:UPF0755 protein